MPQSRVSFKAQNEITLLPGFEARNGSEFLGYLGNCEDAQLLRVNADKTLSNSKSHDEVALVKAADEKINKIRIYPNPSSGIVYINGEAEVLRHSVINIVDNLGTMVFSKRVENNSTNQTINLEKLANGIYFLQITKNSNVISYARIVLSK